MINKIKEHVLKSALAAMVCCMALTGCNNDDDITENNNAQPDDTPKECIRPGFLQPGDKVAVVSPSYVTDDVTIQMGMDAIREMGFDPILAPNTNRTYLVKYAGTAEERTSDLEWAYNNPEIKAIMCTRGGYGAVQLLPLINTTLIRNNPKWLIGYSDITTLLSLSVATANVMAIHGTMLSSLKNTKGKAEDDIMLRDMLCGDVPRYDWQSIDHPNRSGSARGILVGGNMSTFTPLIGSPYDFVSQGDIILFVEEIGENARNIDRMMYSLKIHGVMPRVKGILVGDFAGCGDEFQIGSIEEMFDKYTLADLQVPIAYGFRAGHNGVNWPLIEGAPVTLNVTTDRASLTFE